MQMNADQEGNDSSAFTCVDPLPIRLVLASQSPRRRDLLFHAGLPHNVRPATLNEDVLPGEAPVDYVRRLAREKACAVTCGPDEVVIGADTTVVCEGRILGKPEDEADARRMLRGLSGKRHDVITGVCLRHALTLAVEHEVTGVWFDDLSEADIEDLIRSGETMDKAGAYAIQGRASRYVSRIEGSYSNVVGLPVGLVWRELRKLTNSLSAASSCRVEG
jgi:septum formation protein